MQIERHLEISKSRTASSPGSHARQSRGRPTQVSSHKTSPSFSQARAAWRLSSFPDSCSADSLFGPLTTWRDAPVGRPLLSMKTAMVVLNRDEHQVMRLIKQSALVWAFDVRRAASQRAAVRIFGPCLAEDLAAREPPGPEPRDLEEVLHAIL